MVALNKQTLSTFNLDDGALSAIESYSILSSKATDGEKSHKALREEVRKKVKELLDSIHIELSIKAAFCGIKNGPSTLKDLSEKRVALSDGERKLIENIANRLFNASMALIPLKETEAQRPSYLHKNLFPERMRAFCLVDAEIACGESPLIPPTPTKRESLSYWEENPYTTLYSKL